MSLTERKVWLRTLKPTVKAHNPGPDQSDFRMYLENLYQLIHDRGVREYNVIVYKKQVIRLVHFCHHRLDTSDVASCKPHIFPGTNQFHNVLQAILQLF